MFSRLATCLVLFVVCINLFNFDIKVHTLLYPPTTVYQMIGSVSIAISGLPKTRKAFVDWGFQMNYQMPFNLSEFYMVPIWSTGTNNMQKRQGMFKTVLLHLSNL
uniref:Uncharacterized protein n=1 Tax=Glossina brevipalpis TaxID=37001 RepID=A0A1A9WLP9_9MUSC